MARISVEQKALTDSRFAHLGLALGAETAPAAFGLGVMLYVWNECQEQSTYTLPKVALDAIGIQLGVKNLGKAIAASNLGVTERYAVTRIKGTEGRIEWLEDSRKSNRERQKRHRERARSQAESNALVTRESRGALAPAPAPALEDREREDSAAPSGASAPPPPDPIAFTFPAKDGSAWALPTALLEELSRAYPTLSALTECAEARAWCIANPPKRKTAAGMPRFLNAWLARSAKDAARNPAQRKQPGGESWRQAGDPTLKPERIDKFTEDRRWIEARREEYRRFGKDETTARAMAAADFNQGKRASQVTR